MLVSEILASEIVKRQFGKEIRVPRLSWKITVSLVLLISSFVLGVLHLLVFDELRTLLFYLALDVVFVPVQVLMVTIIIERLLTERERQSLLKKLNMVIGAFFSEVGNSLMQEMGSTCLDFEELGKRLSIGPEWKKEEFETALQFIEGYTCRINARGMRLDRLRTFLVSKRQFMLGLLQNPNLLEHERFSDLLWAICHLTEELEARRDMDLLPTSDLMHLEKDIQRALGMLIREWLSYLHHLKEAYPYMYSLALRINPLNPHANPIVS